MRSTLNMFPIFLLTTIFLLSHNDICYAIKDRNVPHSHNGKLKPYKPGPFPNLQLSNEELRKLSAGEPVMKQIIPSDPKESGSVLCVQDVNAPVSAVWNQILDLDSYKKKVSKVNENKNYFVKRQPNGCWKIKTKQVLGVLPGYSYESYYDHTYYPSESSLIWTLDYEKTSDFDDVSGHWHVQGLDNTKSRVFYACDIKMKGSVPGPILNYISKQALKQATAWVKRESEANPTNTVLAAQYGTKVPSPSIVKTTSIANSSLSTKGSGDATVQKNFFSFRGGSVRTFFNPKLKFVS